MVNCQTKTFSVVMKCTGQHQSRRRSNELTHTLHRQWDCLCLSECTTLSDQQPEAAPSGIFVNLIRPQPSYPSKSKRAIPALLCCCCLATVSGPVIEGLSTPRAFHQGICLTLTLYDDIPDRGIQQVIICLGVHVIGGWTHGKVECGIVTKWRWMQAFPENLPKMKAKVWTRLFSLVILKTLFFRAFNTAAHITVVLPSHYNKNSDSWWVDQIDFKVSWISKLDGSKGAKIWRFLIILWSQEKGRRTTRVSG